MVRYGRQHRHRGNTHTTPSWLRPNQHVWIRQSVTPLAVLQEDGATIAANYGAEYCPENVSYYATPVDPSKPWTGSPKSQPIQLEDPGLNWGAVPNRVIPDMERWQAHGFCPRPGAVPKEKMLAMRSSKLSLKYWWHRVRLFWDNKACERIEKDWPGLHGTKRVPLASDWKAYGYWARPFFTYSSNNGVSFKHNHVSNSTPRTRPKELSEKEVEEMVESLRDPDGTFHASRWVPRSEHPMLPKRPDLWPTPHASLENLTYKTPSELILNPLLEHRKLGRPPMLFDIRMGLENILIGGHEGHDWFNPHLGADSQNAYQPATFPGVTAMSINLLAEDTRTTFGWKFTVLPHHPSLPVMVIDVLYAIKQNFDQNIYDSECATIVGERRNQMWYAFEHRIKLTNTKRLGGLRRVDYLGDHYYFRGLEPAPDNEGWMIYFGAP